MKGQYAMEYMFVIALILALLIPTLWIAFNRSSETTTGEQASSTVKAIGSVADEVYYLGPGNKNTISVSMPAGTASFNLTRNEVILAIRISDKISEYFTITKGNLTGVNITNPTRGIKYVTAEHLDTGQVLITMT